MTTEAPAALRMTRRFAASPERVFDAWTRPAIARLWLFTSPESERRSHELDARTGGRWTITDRRGGTDHTASGEYLEVARPRRLVFTFAMLQFSPNSDRITVDLAPDGDGCVMTFSQEGSDIAEELHQLAASTAGGSETGWRRMFEALAGLLARSQDHGIVVEPGTVRFERLLPGPIERVWAYLTESDERGQWLASGEMEPRAGAAFDLHFDHAGLSPDTAPTPERFKRYEGGHTSRHQITRFEPPRGLSFTWGEGADGPSEVSFDLTQEGENVRLVLTHRRLADAKAMISVAGGWHTHLAVLDERLNGRTAPSFWTLFGGIEEDYAKRFGATSG